MRRIGTIAFGVLVAAGLAGCAQTTAGSTTPSAPAVSSVATAAPSVRAPLRTQVAAVAIAPAALAVSAASSTRVQPQPPAGSCHASSTTPFSLPDPHCTPGALNPAVTQATLASTICRSGYSTSIRPPESVTEPEKIASLRSYGDPNLPGNYEYDHLVSLELGGAANSALNLWPEPEGSPNPKDSLENRLHSLVCNGTVTLAVAQRLIATNWIAGYQHYIGPAVPTASHAPTPAPVATAPAPPGTGTCTAAMSNAAPSRGSSETLTVHGPANAGVSAQVHYKSTTHPYSGVANSAGTAVITFSIGEPTANYAVNVTVTAGSSSCSTHFTPQ